MRQTKRTWTDPSTRNFALTGALLMLVGGVTGITLIFLGGLWSLALAAVGRGEPSERRPRTRPLSAGDAAT
jgi:hypothetical protein